MFKNIKEKKAFTLAELLIVVAIIGVLVAVSIPIFSTQLEKSREHTDEANLRAAKAAAIVLYLDNNESAGTYYYDANRGNLVAVADSPDDLPHAFVDIVTADDIEPYGKGGKKIGDKDMSFKMTSNQEDTCSNDKVHIKTWPTHIHVEKSAPGEALTISVTADEDFDGFYKGDDEVRDDIIKVGIASCKSSGINATADGTDASDHIYLEWVSEIENSVLY